MKDIAEKNKADRKLTQDSPIQNLGTTVNVFGYKKSIRGFIIRIAERITKFIIQDKEGQRLFEKKLICLLYNRLHLLHYISDKRINCFIWKDDGADDAYIQYVNMMQKVYDNCSVEIITMNNKKK